MQHSRSLSPAELLISREISAFQERVLKNWRGHEKEGLYELVRALDVIAVGRMLRAEVAQEAERPHEHHCLVGAAVALRPFISAIQGTGGGVPFAPTNTTYSEFAHSYLDACGRLSNLKRLASLEKHGVARTQIISPNHLVIRLKPDSLEWAAREAIFHLRSRYKRDGIDSVAPNEIDWDGLRQRMSSYVDVASEWFIRYDNDWEIVLAYRDAARDFGIGYFESEALPDDVALGGRTFGEWKAACEQALGRVLCHIDFALLLAKKNPIVDLRNVLTIFVRKDDVAEVWQEAGLQAQRIQPTLNALSLNMESIGDWEDCFETPATYYIDFGKDFYLLPCFGAISNPYFALFRHLRRVHEKEWSSGVDRREQVFRQDLATAFPAPRFSIPEHGVKLRRPNGSVLTDIDAVIFDNETGSIALIQLKWHDVFGRSVREWASRKRNLDIANAWVDKVMDWIGSQNAADVAAKLGFRGPRSNFAPQVYVLARYSAAFSGECAQDNRATWLGWPELLHGLENAEGADPIAEIPVCVESFRNQFADVGKTHEKYEFPTLTVELYVD
ncbi:hypothetical protein [Uliginosibacterium sediminicola]|uniref:PD-(D/E)XK nuclease superfamily protein n=1 Tax=Uliginosibacterium sediminicola TaxID=2024550 RepID=A0ABU9YUZ7_9RHOO